MRTIGNTPVDGEVRAVASGTLPSGQPVIVNADGTVSVAGTSTVTEIVGSNVVFEAGYALNIDSAYDSNAQKVVVAYRDADDSSKGKAVVGTISGTSVSFGTPVVFDTSNSQAIAVAYDASTQKVVIAYNVSSNSGYVIVGTVSGTSISFGTRVSLGTQVYDCSVVYDSSAQKVVIAYKETSVANYGAARVGTVSGTSISFGTQVNFASHVIYETKIAFDSTNNKVVIVYTNGNDGQKGTSIVGTVSGTSISFGSAVVFDAGEITAIDVAYDVVSGKSVIVYQKGPGGNQGANAIVGTISGTGISFGTAVVYDSGSGNEYNSIVYHEAAEKVIVVYWDNSNSDRATALTGTVSGTTISFENSVVLEQGASAYIAPTYDSTNKVVFVAYRDGGNSNYGTGVVYQPTYSATNLTSENYIGMSGGVAIPTVTGAKVSFESSTMGSEYIGATYDPDTGKIILAYQDEGNSFYGTAVVGTVSGTSISFGTPVVFQTSKTKDFCAVYDTSNDKVVITYCNEASFDAGTGIVGTVSGTSISFGSPAVFDSNGAGTPHSSVYDTNAGKVVVFYRDTSDSSKGKASVGTVSGTSISWGSLVNFNGNDYTTAISAVYDSTAQKIVVCFADVGNSTYGSSVVGTVSGTSISFGTKVVFSSSSTSDAFVTYDSSNNKSVVTYKDGGDSDKGKVSVATVSGTSISFGTPVTFVSQVGSNYNCAYDTQLGSVIISYGVPLGQGKFITGTVSGTSIGDFSSPYSYYSDTNRVIRPQLVIDGGTGNAVFSFKDQDDSNKGSSTVTSIGFAGSVADGDNAVINSTCTVDSNQSGLTAGQKYYVQTDGTLGLTAADPSVFAGTAVSATKLIVKG